MQRRHFLKSLAGTGALIATAQLPSWGEDRPEVFPERGTWERLSLSYAVVKIGLERPFSVLHLTDSHLAAAYPDESDKKQRLHLRRTQTFGGHQEEALRDALDWAKDHVEFVVHTGDLIDWQSQENFDLVRKYFGDGLVGSVGNHEFTPDMWLSEPKEERTEAFKDRTRDIIQEVYPFNVRFASQVANGVNFVTLDDVYGSVTEEQVALFKEEVKKGLPIVLCMHVPFFTETIWRAQTRFWIKGGKMEGDGSLAEPVSDYKTQLEDPVTRDFIAYLKQEPLLKCILAGHLHISVEDQFSPTCRQYVTAGGFLFHGREVIFL